MGVSSLNYLAVDILPDNKGHITEPMKLTIVQVPQTSTLMKQISSDLNVVFNVIYGVDHYICVIKAGQW